MIAHLIAQSLNSFDAFIICEMRFVIGDVLYEFKVAGSSDFPATIDYSAAEFQVDLRYRKFESTSRSPAIELQRSLRLPRAGAETLMSSELMYDALHEFDVPENIRENMATHFKFQLERLSRLNSRRSGNIPVTATIDVRCIPPEKAAEVQRRRNAAAAIRQNEYERPSVAGAPASRAAVEALERERYEEEEEERECGICLERMVGGEEVIKMPCIHVYHEECIVSWLQRNHFCPFCHFKLNS